MSTRQTSLKGYWSRNVRLVCGLLVIWLLVSLVPWAFAELPVDWTVFGWPLSFALAAFGVPLIYLVLIGVYACIMARRDGRVIAEELTSPNLSDDSKRNA